MLETQSKVEYKMLAGPALLPLVAKMSKQGEPLPNLALMVAFVAEVDGEIVSHCVIQSLPVLEPSHAEIGHSTDLRQLVRMAKEWIMQSGAPRVIVRTSEVCVLKDMVKREEMPVLSGMCYDWRREDHV